MKSSLFDLLMVSQRSIGPVDAFIVPPASEVLINPQSLELAVRNIRRRAGDLSLSREIRNRLVDTLQNNLANSINPIFLPLFYETYDNEADFHAISCLAFLIICRRIL